MQQVETYVRENYKRLYGEKPLIIIEHDSFFTVQTNKDESPLILSKGIV